MMRKGLMAMMATVAVMLLSNCATDDSVRVYTEEEKLTNAAAALEIDSIDPNQDWNMTGNATAAITIMGNYGETYAVKIYSNDPLADGMGYVLAEGEVESGSTFEASFEYPSADTRLMVGVADHSGYTTYRYVPVVDHVMTAVIGETTEARSSARSMAAPSVPHLSNIPDQAYVNTYLEGAVEPNDANSYANYKAWVDGEEGHYALGEFTVNDWELQGDDKTWWVDNIQKFTWWQFDSYGVSSREEAWEIVKQRCIESGRSSWLKWVDATEGHWVYGDNYVDHFKITGTWNKAINVVATEGLTDGVPNHCERTVVVTGTWNLSDNNQRVGSRGLIIVANGGTLNIPSGRQLELVNQSRLVVMPGGTVSGDGQILVTNGNEAGYENYNGGTINVGIFNNNFGKFFNYNKFMANEYRAGGQESNFYNHGIVNIDHSAVYNNDWYTEKNAPNARIFNACQWYCKNDMSARNIEMTAGSYMYVGRELVMSSSNDGTSDPTYVSLASGSLLCAGWLNNNGTIWYGPTSGLAVVEFEKIKYLNWDGDGPLTSGYFANNIAVSVEDKTNNCMGKTNENAYSAFQKYVANGLGTNGNATMVGNGGVVMVKQGKANIVIPGSNEFVRGEKGCAPGYNGIPQEETENRPSVWSYAYEDTPIGDYDMNDVVLKVSYHYDEDTKTVDKTMLDVTLCCTGASLSLKAYLGHQVLFGNKEVHDFLGQKSGMLINTGIKPDVEVVTAYIQTPENFSFADADFWIDSPAVVGGVHIAKKGQDPHGIVIPSDWEWPVEYVCIKDAYPNFVEFAKDASTTDETVKGWYKKSATNPVADKVYRVK